MFFSHATWKLPLQARISSGLTAIALISLAVTGVVLGARQFGAFQALELRMYDRMVRFRPDAAPDPRLLIVTITEADIRQLPNGWPPSDQVLANALQMIEQHQPQVIGLDIYRDVAQGTGQAELQHQLQSSRLIAITLLGDLEENSVPPPPTVPEERVGFNDLLIDPDGVIRRALLFGGSYYAFSLRLALSYLAEQGIEPQPSASNPDNLQLGQATFVPLEANSGGYQISDAQGYQMLLNYRTRRQVARQLSLAQVLNQDFEPDWIRNKVVLVGTAAPSIKDWFSTPYSAAAQTQHQMTGVEIHAQITSQLIDAALGDRSLFWFWTEWQEWLWILAWAGLSGTLAWFIRHPMLLGAGSTLLLAGLAGTNFLLLLQQGWVPIVAPAIASVLTAGTVTTYRAQYAQRQQQMVMRLLGQNASPEIATALWNERDRLLQSGKLPGQRLIATLLFTDIRNFSTISEQMSPEGVLDWLNEYLAEMTQEIQNHQGIINKFTGDGLLAVFGVPVPRTTEDEVAQDAQRAVACALAMGDRLQQLNQDWQLRGLPVVQMRVGIFTGPVVVGSLGGRNRMEYGVIGDSVNTAARLESCARERQDSACRVLIADNTLKYLQEQFQVESWGLMELKGKQQKLEVYQVTGRRG